MKILALYEKLIEIRLLGFLKHLTLCSYSLATEEGRVNERLRLLSWAILTSGFSKLGSLFIVVASIRWVNEYLDAERFGLWMTITSIIALLSFVDLGMSNSLVNVVSEQSGLGRIKDIRVAISSALCTLIGAATFLGLLFLFSLYLVNWLDAFGASNPQSRSEIIPSLAVYIFIFSITLPLSVVHKVQMGLQEAWKSNLFVIVGQFFAISLLAVVVSYKAGVPYLILAIAGGPAMATTINFFLYFYFQRKDLSPNFRLINKTAFKKIGFMGTLFLVMQFLALLGNSTDNLVIAKILGLNAVSTYSIVQKLTMFLGVSQLLIVPMWPIFGEAIARGDELWAKRSLINVLWVSLFLGCLAGLVILVYGNQIIKIWVGHSIETTTNLMLGFALYSVLMGLGGALSVYLNNGRYLRRQIYIYATASIAALLLKVIFVSYLREPSGAIWATNITYAVLFVVPAFVIIFAKKVI